MPDSVQTPDISAALRRDFRMLIAGQLSKASDGKTLATTNPATSEHLADLPNAGPDDIDLAVRAAAAAQPQWARLSYGERRAGVLKLAAKLRDNAAMLGLLDTLDTGNVYTAMRSDAVWSSDGIEYFASIGHEIKGEVTHLDGNLHYTRRQPYGVVARLLPFNHPIASLATALAAPLLTGNAVILKPSPHTPMSALAFAELAADILPAGVISIVTGDNERCSVPLIRHPGINRISLIGSTAAGRAVMAMAAERLVPVTLELGGKNPLIIFPDADVGASVEAAIAGMNFKWQSHSCASTSRILVHKSVKARFLDRLVEKVGRIRVAMPLDPAAEMGAISYRALYDRCLAYLDSGRAQGAKLLVGGTRPTDPAMSRGLFLTPAVFGDATPSMSIARDEIFGPIITVIEWDDYDRMIQIANELPYGLTAVIMTENLDAAHRTAEALDAGYVEVNGTISWAQGSPYGGFKQSGIGREGSLDELVSYTQIKSINVKLKPRPVVMG